MPGREPFESGEPVGVGEMGHVLEQRTLLAIQGACLWEKATWAFNTPGKRKPFCEERLRHGFQTGSSDP